NSDSIFEGWTGACSGTSNVCTVAMTENRSVTAGFKRRSFTITASAGSHGSIAPSGVKAVAYGGSQSYTITAATGYQVADVKIDNVSAGPLSSYEFSNVKANHTIAVTFSRIVNNTATRKLTISHRGSGRGAVTTDPAGTVFPLGTAVTVRATPEGDSTFVGWSRACSGAGSECQVTMNANKSVNATFETVATAAFQLYLPLVVR
ncbi:MAG: hypothetical protein HY892_07070, partial [Deltaproteobacteria bacterium]|nr:hypothetical protein [Deltaproteobacteria bacterium]